jgi:hypothetical protein
MVCEGGASERGNEQVVTYVGVLVEKVPQRCEWVAAVSCKGDAKGAGTRKMMLHSVQTLVGLVTTAKNTQLPHDAQNVNT